MSGFEHSKLVTVAPLTPPLGASKLGTFSVLNAPMMATKSVTFSVNLAPMLVSKFVTFVVMFAGSPIFTGPPPAALRIMAAPAWRDEFDAADDPYPRPHLLRGYQRAPTFTPPPPPPPPEPPFAEECDCCIIRILGDGPAFITAPDPAPFIVPPGRKGRG